MHVIIIEKIINNVYVQKKIVSRLTIFSIILQGPGLETGG